MRRRAFIAVAYGVLPQFGGPVNG